jgi:aryl-alcohol dehydrogenase-like predicted oxidoreductase
MEQRTLGSTKRLVSVVGLGTWQLGSDWGSVDETAAAAVLDASADAGVTFFETADVYGTGVPSRRSAHSCAAARTRA